MSFVLFAGIFLGVMALINVYIYRRFLRKLSALGRPYGLAIVGLLMLGECVYILDFISDLIPDIPLLYVIASASVGISFILFVMATLYDLTITVSARVPFDRTRRRSIKILFDVTMLIASISYVLRGLSQGLKAPLLNTVHVTISEFPTQGYTIVQLTDIHVGHTIGRDYVADLVRRSNELKPDMVVITGDLVDLPLEQIREKLLPIREIEAPCYFILGNHEYFHGPNPVLRFLREVGVQPLLNSSVVIGEGEGRFNLVGINDLIGERMGMYPPDLDAAYRDVDPTLPTLVLAHQPKTIERMAGHRCDLMISGHTHGGQIFPFGFLVMMDQPYLAGLHRHNGEQQIFVSRGTGFWGPPLRVLAPSEISRIVINPG